MNFLEGRGGSGVLLMLNTIPAGRGALCGKGGGLTGFVWNKLRDLGNFLIFQFSDLENRDFIN